jgi:Phosphatidylinositol 3- and 4-kinase
MERSAYFVYKLQLLVANTDTHCVLPLAHLSCCYRAMQQFMAMAPSPEAFLTVRAEFARSLAVFNISSYMVGIGDRYAYMKTALLMNQCSAAS